MRIMRKRSPVNKSLLSTKALPQLSLTAPKLADLIKECMDEGLIDSQRFPRIGKKGITATVYFLTSNGKKWLYDKDTEILKEKLWMLEEETRAVKKKIKKDTAWLEGAGK